MSKIDAPFYVISVDDFDCSLLPADARKPGTESFRTAVQGFFEKEYEELGGQIEAIIDDDVIRVSWKPDRMMPEYVDLAIERLRRKDYDTGISILRSLLEFAPDEETVLYNLGMAESDAGKLEAAEEHLRHLVELAPRHANAHVALGVALKRRNKDGEALTVLRKAEELDRRNPFGQRNLGACLLSMGEALEAEIHLQKAVSLNPSDPQAWFGLAQARESLQKRSDADEAYLKVIEIAPSQDIAEMARTARSRIAQEEYKDVSRGAPRPDAVMYCLASLEQFEKMEENEVRQVTLEIAVLGRSGFDVNNPAKQYHLASLPGEYSGLQLVCMMYVGFKELDIDHDIGFDLSAEYETARGLHRKKRDTQ